MSSSLKISLARLPPDEYGSFRQIVPVCSQNVAVLQQGRGEMATRKTKRRAIRIFEFIEDVFLGGMPGQTVITADDCLTTAAIAGAPGSFVILAHDVRHHQLSIGHKEKVGMHT